MIFQLSFVFWIWVKGLDVLTALPRMTSLVMWKKRVQHCWASPGLDFRPPISWVYFLQVSYLGFGLELTAQRQARVSLLNPLTQGHTGHPLSPLLHSPATRGPCFCSDQQRHLSNAKLAHLWILKLWNIIFCSQTLNSYGVEVCHWPFNRYWFIPTLHPILCHTETQTWHHRHGAGNLAGLWVLHR